MPSYEAKVRMNDTNKYFIGVLHFIAFKHKTFIFIHSFLPDPGRQEPCEPGLAAPEQP